MKKYVVDRLNVYAGRLMRKPDCIIEARNFLGEPFSKFKPARGRVTTLLSDEDMRWFEEEQKRINEGTFIRPMLFQFSPKYVAEDLRYTNSAYRIEGHCPLEDTAPHYRVENVINLGGILGKLGYSDKLTQGDVNRIYRTLLCSQRIILEMMRRLKITTDDKGNLICLGKGIPCSEHVIEELLIISTMKNGFPAVSEPNYELMEKKR